MNQNNCLSYVPPHWTYNENGDPVDVFVDSPQTHCPQNCTSNQVVPGLCLAKGGESVFWGNCFYKEEPVVSCTTICTDNSAVNATTACVSSTNVSPAGPSFYKNGAFYTYCTDNNIVSVISQCVSSLGAFASRVPSFYHNDTFSAICNGVTDGTCVSSKGESVPTHSFYNSDTNTWTSICGETQDGKCVNSKGELLIAMSGPKPSTNVTYTLQAAKRLDTSCIASVTFSAGIFDFSSASTVALCGKPDVASRFSTVLGIKLVLTDVSFSCVDVSNCQFKVGEIVFKFVVPTVTTTTTTTTSSSTTTTTTTVENTTTTTTTKSSSSDAYSQTTTKSATDSYAQTTTKVDTTTEDAYTVSTFSSSSSAYTAESATTTKASKPSDIYANNAAAIIVGGIGALGVALAL
ncbi:UNVERIFIED_CONTAM: hypothetical protein HDU68_007404 [Siphonaria sp. JEL0065]|nr:hypothetical protein HDU68_007404 [Siphonaria sp. JEL0065]